MTATVPTSASANPYRRAAADQSVEVLATARHAGPAPTHYAADRALSPFAREVEADLRDRYQALKESGLLSVAGVGNASRREPGTERIVLGGFYPYTPYGDGVPRTVTIDLADGRIIEGEAHAALIEVAPLYVAVHRERPELGSVIHSHSPGLAAFAVARTALAIRDPVVRTAVGADRIPVTRWGTRYEPQPIVEALREHPGVTALLHGNHGPFVFGSDLAQVFYRLALLEEAARTALLAARIT